MAMPIKVWNTTMHVTVLQGKDPKTKRIKDENGKEFEVIDDGSEPLHDKIAKHLRKMYPDAGR